MADEENQQNEEGQENAGKVDPLKGVDEKFNTLAQELKAMNQQFNSSFNQLAQNLSQQRREAPAAKSEDLDVYDPDSIKNYLNRIEEASSQKVGQIIQKERELNATAARLAQDYPEINSDKEITQAVLEEHKLLDKSLQETSTGYELAVARVAAKRGLLPKSKRQAAPNADEFSSPGSSSSRPQKQKKTEVSDVTRTVSELLGQDTESPEYKKRMEGVMQRKTYYRYE